MSQEKKHDLQRMMATGTSAKAAATTSVTSNTKHPLHPSSSHPLDEPSSNGSSDESCSDQSSDTKDPLEGTTTLSQSQSCIAVPPPGGYRISTGGGKAPRKQHSSSSIANSSLKDIPPTLLLDNSLPNGSSSNSYPLVSLHLSIPNFTAEQIKRCGENCEDEEDPNHDYPIDAVTAVGHDGMGNKYYRAKFTGHGVECERVWHSAQGLPHYEWSRFCLRARPESNEAFPFAEGEYEIEASQDHIKEQELELEEVLIE